MKYFTQKLEFKKEGLPMVKIIAVSNQKGGVGKTATSVNLSFGLAREGKKVLLIDLDAQGSATLSLGYQPDEMQITIHDILQNVIDDTYMEPAYGILHHEEGVDLIPSNISLATIEYPLMQAVAREKILASHIEEIKDTYDYILIDCLPSLNILATNALTAADTVLIPVQPQHLSVNGMEQLLVTIGKVKKRLNKNLTIAGILPTMVNGRTNSMKDIINLLKESYRNETLIFDSIPQSIRMSECSIEGKSIFTYDPHGKAAIAYQKLTSDILKLHEGEKA